MQLVHYTFQQNPLRLALLFVNLFIRPHLDYGDTIYDQAYIASFHQRIESFQYNSELAITGAIRGTSQEKLCLELGLETIEKRRWYRKLCCFFNPLVPSTPIWKYLGKLTLASILNSILAFNHH